MAGKQVAEIALFATNYNNLLSRDKDNFPIHKHTWHFQNSTPSTAKYFISAPIKHLTHGLYARTQNISLLLVKWYNEHTSLLRLDR